ncbi:hypothetical protein KC973_02305 [Candidatus Saccharibacteria bacterium]|nr:hypothetical protein [Candidatus Saccharibacteria bacterium]
MNIRDFSPEGPNKPNAVRLCKGCPRRNDASTEVYRSIDFALWEPDGDGSRRCYGYDKQFYGDSGTGFTYGMPVNTTLDDIDQCGTPVVIRSEGFLGLRKVRECGAVICALERYKQEQQIEDPENLHDE